MSASSSAPIRIVVMEGDGIGPEITAATMDVLYAADRLFKLGFDFSPVTIGLEALRGHHAHRCGGGRFVTKEHSRPTSK